MRNKFEYNPNNIDKNGNIYSESEKMNIPFEIDRSQPEIRRQWIEKKKRLDEINKKERGSNSFSLNPMEKGEAIVEAFFADAY